MKRHNADASKWRNSATTEELQLAMIGQARLAMTGQARLAMTEEPRLARIEVHRLVTIAEPRLAKIEVNPPTDRDVRKTREGKEDDRVTGEHDR